MNTVTFKALNAYKNIGIENSVDSANPHKLILMLFEGTQIAIRAARQHMKDNEIAQKGTAISKAIAIIDNGLRASLDTEKGGEMAQNLQSLYEYIVHRLLIANIKNKPEILDEVAQLLSELHSAWAAISIPKTPHNTAMDNHPPSADLITLSYGKV